MFEVAQKLRAFLDRQSRIHLSLLFIPMLGVAILEMASIGMIIPFIHILISPNKKSVITEKIFEILPNFSPDERLFWVSLLFMALFALKNIVLFFMIFIINHTIQRKLAIFVQRLFVRYLSQPLAFHLKKNSAEIIRNLHSSAARAFESVRLLLMITLEGVLVLVAFFLLILIEPTFTSIAALVLVIFAFIFHQFAGPHFVKWGRRSQFHEVRMIKTISESLRSIRDVKLLNVLGYLSSAFAVETNGLAKNNARLASSQALPRLFVETIVIFGFAATVLGLMLVKDSIEEIIATLALFGMASLRLMPSMNRILTSAVDLKNRLASVDVIYSDLTETQFFDLDESKNKSSLLIPFNKNIVFSNIGYRYPNSERYAISDFSIEIKKGNSVGIIGPNGSGKSTALDLMLGLLQPDSGSILVDGFDIQQNIDGWQRQIGYVPQEIYLIDNSLRRNIAFGLEDEEINEDRVVKAAAMANLDAVIEQMPAGLDTYVGEGGSKLSGGQRQRVAIARALYRDPNVLIFDEATASLDKESEAEVAETVESLRGIKTVVIVAHSPYIVRKCDRIFVLSNGHIENTDYLKDIESIEKKFFSD